MKADKKKYIVCSVASDDPSALRFLGRHPLSLIDVTINFDSTKPKLYFLLNIKPKKIPIKDSWEILIESDDKDTAILGFELYKN